MSPIFQGFVRLRKHQFGRQSVFGTVVPATRAYNFTGTPAPNPNWTDSAGDVGSLDPVAPPFRVAPDLPASLTDDSVTYNALPLAMCAFFGGAESPVGAGTAKTWTHTPASLSADDPDVFSYEFGDDVTTDWDQFSDGILDSVEFSGPEGLGPLTSSMTWRFGGWNQTGSTDNPVVGVVPTPGLDVDRTAAIVYLKDGAIYISDAFATLFDPGSKVSGAWHAFTLRLSHEVDVKRTADGTQTFDAAGYGPGARQIELECTFAKTADTVGVGSESDKWMSNSAVNRYVGLRFISTVLAESPSTYYAWDVSMPLRYFTRANGESGQNTIITLAGRAFYDPTYFQGVFESVVVNTLTEAELGVIGS